MLNGDFLDAVVDSSVTVQLLDTQEGVVDARPLRPELGLEKRVCSQSCLCFQETSFT